MNNTLRWLTGKQIQLQQGKGPLCCENYSQDHGWTKHEFLTSKGQNVHKHYCCWFWFINNNNSELGAALSCLFQEQLLYLHLRIFFPRVIHKSISKALGRHVLINILPVIYERGAASVSCSAPLLQLPQTSPSRRRRTLGAQEEPCKEHAVLEMHLGLEGWGGPRNAAVLREAPPTCPYFRGHPAELSAALFSLLSGAGGRAICQGSAHSLPPFCQACSRGNTWAAAPELQSSRAAAQPAFTCPWARPGAACRIMTMLQSNKINKQQRTALLGPHWFLKHRCVRRSRAKTSTLGCLMMKSVTSRRPVSLGISPLFELSPSLSSSSQPESLAIRPMAFLL